MEKLNVNGGEKMKNFILKDILLPIGIRLITEYIWIILSREIKLFS
jgi:hypothetical protein